MKRATIVVAVLVGLLTISSCGYSTPSDMVAVQVGGGWEAKKVKGCVDANERDWFWQTNDTYKYFPTSEREWDATGQKGSDPGGRMSSVSKDSVLMKVPVTIRFTLKTECKTLTAFYTKYARQKGAEFDNDGSYNDEWVTLLRKLVRDPADQTLDRIVQGYNWRDVWQNPETKVEIEKKMNEALQSESSLMVQTAKGNYFEGISVLIGTPTPGNQDLMNAVSQEQTAVSKAKSEEAQANADAAKARAQVAVSQAEAAKQRATIGGFKSEEAYLRWVAITSGLNPFQPTYLVNGTKP